MCQKIGNVFFITRPCDALAPNKKWNIGDAKKLINLQDNLCLDKNIPADTNGGSVMRTYTDTPRHKWHAETSTSGTTGNLTPMPDVLTTGPPTPVATSTGLSGGAIVARSKTSNKYDEYNK